MLALQKMSRCYKHCKAVQRAFPISCNLKFCTKSNLDNEAPKLGNMGSKYQVFKDEDSEIIFDIYEERERVYNEARQEQDDIWNTLNLERGVNGVFEIEDLIKVLKIENSEDIFVATVPPELKYVQYICVVTGKSRKHMRAIADFVRKVYKKKMHKTDYVPTLEGKKSEDWMALDLGNIALHILSRDARKVYDLDSLWSVGPQYDNECNKQDPIVEMLEQNSIYLADLKPAS